jgi:hypothetical protein
MQQKTRKQLLIYGLLFSIAPIIIQIIGIDSKFNTQSITNTVGFDIVSLASILITVFLALAGGKFLMQAITYKWNSVSTLNPYPELYKMSIFLGIATAVSIISLAIKFSRL